jgi:hypothetical protein
MLNKILVLLFAVFLIVGATTLNGLHSHGQNPMATKQDAPTPVQEGVMTEKQREHSKLYKDYKGVGKLRDIVEQEANKGTDEVSVTVLPRLPELAPASGGASTVRTLEDLASNSDAIVVGTVTSKTSQLTEDGTFVFTDYILIAEEVLKDYSAAGINPFSNLTVTRPGGKILLNGRVVNAIDKSFGRLVVGSRYVLFLKHVSSTGAYRSVNDKGSFGLDNNCVVTLTEAPDAEARSGRDAASFIREVRSAITASTRNTRNE